MFDYRHKAVADQIRKSCENLVQHVSTKYRKYIIKELHNKTILNITAPVHSPQVLVTHAAHKSLFCTVQTKIQVDRQS